MDLDDFHQLGLQSGDVKLREKSPHSAVMFVDDVFYSETSRRARWMDLIGDYAGNEMFLMDGRFDFACGLSLNSLFRTR